MRLLHGTSAELRDAIVAEGLRGFGRPVFLAGQERVARRFASARAAQSLAGGRPSIGLLVVIEIDPAHVEPDPFDEREPDQWRTREDIPAACVVETREIAFAWGSLSWERAMAQADAADLERVRAAGQDRWRPGTRADLAANLQYLRKLGGAGLSRDRSRSC